MNVILLTPIIFTLALVHGGGVFYKGNNMTSNLAPKRSNPCQGRSEIDKYNEFIKKHILQRDFDTSSKKAWGEYLEENELCGREEVQSFINKADKGKVLEICSSAGWRLEEVDDKNRNLCISTSDMIVHDVKSTKDCKIELKSEGKHPVIVACDMIENDCLPVHYQKYENQKPSKTACT